jgi:DNA replication protein DnaC
MTRRAEVRASARNLRVPARFQPATIETVDQRQFPQVIKYAAAVPLNMREGNGLLLSGAPGVGKTWAMVALTREYQLRGKGQRRHPDYEFVTAPDLFDNLGDFGERVDDYRQRPWMTTYANIPWLVINDLGKEYRGGGFAEVVPHRLGRILRARSERRLVTHVTTNLTGSELRETYGGSVFSLMAEMTIFCEVPGKDRRLSR